MHPHLENAFLSFIVLLSSSSAATGSSVDNIKSIRLRKREAAVMSSKDGMWTGDVEGGMDGYDAHGRALRVEQYMTAWHHDWSAANNKDRIVGRTQISKESNSCINIPSNFTLCRGVGYNKMILPNLLGHTSLREVTQESSSWLPLLTTSCHADTQLFLCSLYSPVCLPESPSVWPCRSLCESVRAQCEAPMLRYGYPWPDILSCDKFPSGSELCIEARTQRGGNTGDVPCPACAQRNKFDNIIQNYCSSDFAVKVKIKTVDVINSDLRLTVRDFIQTYKYKKDQSLHDASATLANSSAAFYLENGSAKCGCSQLEKYRNVTKNSKNNKGEGFLLMGRWTGNRLLLTYIQKINKDNGKSEKNVIENKNEFQKEKMVHPNRGRDLKRALRAFDKNAQLCNSRNPTSHQITTTQMPHTKYQTKQFVTETFPTATTTKPQRKKKHRNSKTTTNSQN